MIDDDGQETYWDLVCSGMKIFGENMRLILTIDETEELGFEPGGSSLVNAGKTMDENVDNRAEQMWADA